MKALWIATTNLRRTFRVRTNLFFVFLFPMVVIRVESALCAERRVLLENPDPQPTP